MGGCIHYCWTPCPSFSKLLSDLALSTTVSLLGTVFSLPQLAFTPRLFLPVNFEGRVFTHQGGSVFSTTRLDGFILDFWGLKVSSSTFFPQATHTLRAIFFIIHCIKTTFSFSSTWLTYPWLFRIISGHSWWHKLLSTVGYCILWHVHSKVSII